ncbi:MAG: glycogen debranching enzyme N-terminal domain-containing protein [Candidatus Omnitrophica bacterium]|nr:glycogen debranching enzyme N-terminal domain-containing protein [Candidatus Omnitrophota bacterium]
MKQKKLLSLEATPKLSLVPLPLPGLRPILFGPEVCQDLSAAGAKEWIVTNGLGGYASSTLTGMNTRRYHGLLVAAAHPPLRRVVLLSKVEETVIAPGGRFELAANRYAGVVHPEGHRYLMEFRLDPWPTFIYQVGEILLEKSVFLLPGENAVVIGYTLHAGPGPIELAVRPLTAFRDFRWVSHENAEFDTRLIEQPGVLTLHPYEMLPPLVIHHTAELVERSPCWYKNFEYAQPEEGQGVQATEDLWSFGNLLFLLKVGESCALVASTGRRGSVDLTFHERRLENTQAVLAQTMTPPGSGPLTTRLSWTSESFVARSTPGGAETYLLAGFPWSTCWGRDALISLPGLTLATRRFDLARSILETCVSKVKGGLIPVRLAEEDGSAEYDSADTSLWFYWAVWHYWKATRDLKFISKKLLDPMREIMEGYLDGTPFGIRMDEDGLILLSDKELPLTWMDAREPSERGQIPGRAVTPRFGKPVEVNALWYCALEIMGSLGDRLGLKRANTYSRLARLVQEHFVHTFVSPKGFLYDRITEIFQDPSIRPNMLIAASLPFTPVSRTHAAIVLDRVEKELLTPVGIRSLSPEHPQYRGRYQGNLKERASAYHQGTVWTWLIGPYVTTVLKVRKRTRATQEILRRQLSALLPHLEEGGLGALPELFDGDPPHTPRGGISQAWSVGEVLRALYEAKLGDL